MTSSVHTKRSNISDAISGSSPPIEEHMVIARGATSRGPKVFDFRPNIAVSNDVLIVRARLTLLPGRGVQWDSVVRSSDSGDEIRVRFELFDSTGAPAGGLPAPGTIGIGGDHVWYWFDIHDKDQDKAWAFSNVNPSAPDDPQTIQTVLLYARG